MQLKNTLTPKLNTEILQKNFNYTLMAHEITIPKNFKYVSQHTQKKLFAPNKMKWKNNERVLGRKICLKRYLN